MMLSRRARSVPSKVGADIPVLPKNLVPNILVNLKTLSNPHTFRLGAEDADEPGTHTTYKPSNL